MSTSSTCSRSVAERSAERFALFAYIPARGGSKRVPGKNIRPLGGKPIIGHVIETLRGLDFVARVHVSTDDPEIARVAEDHGACCLAPRNPALSGDGPGFSDLMRYDIPRYAEANDGDTQVLFALATAALVPGSIYRDARAVFHDKRPELLMACERYATSPYWALVYKPDGYLTPLYPEKVRINSQDLPAAVTDSGLFYIFDLDDAVRYDSHKDMQRLLPYLVPDEYCADVDSAEDWDLLEYKYAKLNGAAA